jgi:hypothetical protein
LLLFGKSIYASNIKSAKALYVLTRSIFHIRITKKSIGRDKIEAAIACERMSIHICNIIPNAVSLVYAISMTNSSSDATMSDCLIIEKTVGIEGFCDLLPKYSVFITKRHTVRGVRRRIPRSIKAIKSLAFGI